nr:hypothetical protein [Angustibacter aerolatus]
MGPGRAGRDGPRRVLSGRGRPRRPGERAAGRRHRESRRRLLRVRHGARVRACAAPAPTCRSRCWPPPAPSRTCGCSAAGRRGAPSWRPTPRPRLAPAADPSTRRSTCAPWPASTTTTCTW